MKREESGERRRRTAPSARHEESERLRMEEPERGGDFSEDPPRRPYSSHSRPAAPGRGRGKRRGRALKPLLLLFLCLLLSYLAWSFLSPYFGKRYWTLAVFGVDSRDGKLEAGALSDVIMVASLDRRSGRIELVSVFRDTYAMIGEKEYHKLNEAFFKGGHKQALEALEKNLDLSIDDYVSFNWAAVAKAINALGGVDLEISDAEFFYINAFITETVESTGIGSVQLEHAGMNHLDGVQAVAYGRLRLMDTDFNRTARQRKVLSLAMDKAKKANPAVLINVARSVFPEISSSMGIGEISALAVRAKSYQLAETRGFPFSRETKNIGKLDCVVPTTLSSNVTELHKMLYGVDDYKPSAAVEEISAHIGKVSGLTKAGQDAEEAGTGGGSIRKKDQKGGKKKQKAETAAGENGQTGKKPKKKETAPSKETAASSEKKETEERKGGEAERETESTAQKSAESKEQKSEEERKESGASRKEGEKSGGDAQKGEISAEDPGDDAAGPGAAYAKKQEQSAQSDTP